MPTACLYIADCQYLSHLSVHALVDVIKALREANISQVPVQDQANVEAHICELENSDADSHSFQVAYLGFVSAVADHLQIFAPFLPVLAAIGQQMLG
jgi:hypothetical protein